MRDLSFRTPTLRLQETNCKKGFYLVRPLMTALNLICSRLARIFGGLGKQGSALDFEKRFPKSGNKRHPRLSQAAEQHLEPPISSRRRFPNVETNENPASVTARNPRLDRLTL